MQCVFSGHLRLKKLKKSLVVILVQKFRKFFCGHFWCKNLEKFWGDDFRVKTLKNILITFYCKNIEKHFWSYFRVKTLKNFLISFQYKNITKNLRGQFQCKNIDKILSDHFSVKILKNFLVTIFVKKICDQKVTKFCCKKSVTFCRRGSSSGRRGRQNFLFTFVVLIPERVTRSQLRAFGPPLLNGLGLASLGIKILRNCSKLKFFFFSKEYKNVQRLLSVKQNSK